MASIAGENIVRITKEKPLVEFRYSDKGSLISVSGFPTVGVVMGNVVRGDTVNVRGKNCTHWLHIALPHASNALHGWLRATLRRC
jgi:NADH dehydrogenase